MTHAQLFFSLFFFFFFYIFVPPQLIAPPSFSLVIGFPALCSRTLQWSRFELEG